MPGLWTISSIAHDFERNYKLRHPKPSHFRVRQHNGLFERVIGVRDDRWWIDHKDFPTMMFGPYATREEAQRALPLIVIVLELANPKLKPDRKEALLAQARQQAARGDFGVGIQGESQSLAFLARFGIVSERAPQPPTAAQPSSSASYNPEGHKKCPYCAEWIKAEAIVCRFCGHDLFGHR